jgi:hypothetical protein
LVNPDKVSLVDQLLTKNVGREEELLRRVKSATCCFPLICFLR